MAGNVITVVIILFIILIGCVCLNRPYWRSGPKAEYYRTVERFGNPTYFDPRPDGVAVWSKFRKCCPFVRIMVADENVPHDKPKKHCDFIYTTIKYSINSGMRQHVLNISDSIIYDGLKEELTARCHTLEANMATLVLADKVNRELVAPAEVLDGDIYKNYIMQAKRGAASNYKILQSLKDNYKLRDLEYSRCE